MENLKNVILYAVTIEELAEVFDANTSHKWADLTDFQREGVIESAREYIEEFTTGMYGINRVMYDVCQEFDPSNE